MVSAGIVVPGIFPLANMGYFPGINLPNITTVADASRAIPLSTSSSTLPQVVQVPLQQHAAAIVQKLVQVRIYIALGASFFLKIWFCVALMFLFLACMVKSLLF